MFDSLRTTYAQFRLRYPVYFFHHIPKCGGTSVHDALSHWFHINDDYYDEITQQAKPPIDISYINTKNCVCGHFGHKGYMLDQRYPQVFNSFRAHKKYRVFSFLRDPLEMRCSLYRHGVEMEQTEHASLADNIMTFDNYYARIIGLKENDYRSKLDKYFFIGNADELQASFDVLAVLLGKPRLELPIINTTKRNPESLANFLTPDQVSRFKQANKLDYEIFNYTRDRLDLLKSQIRLDQH